MFSVVKMMKEQGNQFDWSQIAIDIPSLPCFKPEAEWPWKKLDAFTAELSDILAEGYVAVSGYIVRVTGENPSVTGIPGLPIPPTFVDCEPVVIYEHKPALRSFDSVTENSLLPLTPIRTIPLDQSGRVMNFVELFGRQNPVDGGSSITAVSYPELDGEERIVALKTVVGILSSGGSVG